MVVGRAAGAQPGHPLPLPARAPGAERAGRASRTWLTAAGLVGIDVPDATDFLSAPTPRAPDWGRDGVVYQVFPDRFARSAAAADRPRRLGGGRGLGRRGRLRGPRPAHAAAALRRRPGRAHRAPRPRRGGRRRRRSTRPRSSPARATTATTRPPSTTVDPLLGGDEAYPRLSRPCTPAAGGSSATSPPTIPATPTRGSRRAATDPTAPTRSFYYFESDGSYASWMGHHTLPKVNHGVPELRAAMFEGPDSVVGAGCVRRTTSTAGASTSPT